MAEPRRPPAARRIDVPGNDSFRVLAPIARCEGIATGPDGFLWTADEDGSIYRIEPGSGGYERVGSFQAQVLGLCLDRGGRIYACLPGERRVDRFDPESGEVTPYCATAAGAPLKFPNWPVFAADGTLYISDSGTEDLDSRTGRVVACPPSGGDARVLSLPTMAFANGLALDSSGALLIAESFAERVLLHDRRGATSVYCELPGMVPDGLAVDAAGGLVVSCYQPNRVVRVDSEGASTVLVDDWTGIRLLTPTNVAFFGDGLRQLAMASLYGSAITAIDYPWGGAALAYPELPD